MGLFPTLTQHALLLGLARHLRYPEPVYAALPKALYDAGLDPWVALELLVREPDGRVSTWLAGLVGEESLEAIRVGEHEGDLVSAVMWAASLFPPFRPSPSCDEHLG